MENIPKTIYIQIGADCDADSFDDLADVTWCQDRIDSNDIRYVHWTELAAKEKELDKAKKLIDGARNIVELCESASPTRSEWRTEWLNNARRILDTPTPKGKKVKEEGCVATGRTECVTNDNGMKMTCVNSKICEDFGKYGTGNEQDKLKGGE